MNHCIFCKIIHGEIPCKKWYEDENFLGFLDIDPKSNGHTLLIPKQHFQDIFSMDEATLSQLMITAQKLAKILTEKLGVRGIQFVQNNGSFQDVKHYHLHIIPSKDQAILPIDVVFDQLKQE